MAKGIIYVMSTVVPGLIKIGKTGTSNFESRMYNLEKNGYSNVVGLKRHFAIEVEDYDEKEALLDTIFSKSQVPNTELFALDINLVIQLLSSFDGKQIYPVDETKETTFEKATDKLMDSVLPEGEYYFVSKSKREKNITKGYLVIKNGSIILKAGSVISPKESTGLSSKVKTIRASLKLKDNVLQQDVKVASMSEASLIVLGRNANAWRTWKDKDNHYIDIYRK